MNDTARTLLNHVMSCAYCYPRSDKYCLFGRKLHKDSNPSIDTKILKVKK